MAVYELIDILRSCAVHHNCGYTHCCCYLGGVNLGYHSACASVGTCTAAESLDIICDFSDNGNKSRIGIFVGVIVKKSVNIRKNNKGICLYESCNNG